MHHCLAPAATELVNIGGEVNTVGVCGRGDWFEEHCRKLHNNSANQRLLCHKITVSNKTELPILL
eukprot:scaffold297411_cov67-Attheya_sp.AAC.1